MISPIRRLFNWHQIVLLQVTDKPSRYQSLNHLGDKGEVGDRPVVLHVRRIEMWFLDQWRDNGMPLEKLADVLRAEMHCTSPSKMEAGHRCIPLELKMRRHGESSYIEWPG